MTTHWMWSEFMGWEVPGEPSPPDYSPRRAILLDDDLADAAGADGLFYGNPGQLWNQFIGILAAGALGFVMTWIILKVLDAIMGLRVTDEEEVEGLDLSQHSETAYSLGGSSMRER